MALSCQPTADWIELPGALINAFKGDFVIHHACGDMIADLLQTLQQEYSHSMTMSKNQVEIRHSTASENRMIDTVSTSDVIAGPSAPIDPSTLQFGFPGTFGTRPVSVDEMVDGYCLPVPSGDAHSDCGNGSGWNITGSLNTDPQKCTSDVNIVYPLVIRPPPDATATQLAAVTPVGDQSAEITGHYRFFMYSRADEHSTATSGPAWAIGTQESVCSLFDLESTLHASSTGGPLPLRGSAPPPGPTPPPSFKLPDGTVFYTVAERSSAAQELFSSLYNKVEGQVGSWAAVLNGVTGGGLDQLADSVGNQVVNCFSSDACSDVSPAWHNVSPGIAVSPDNIRTSWATPGNGGTYGYNEPLIYSPTYFRHQYQWVAATDSAQLTVNVVDGNGNPVANATVVIDGATSGMTNSAGSLVLKNFNPGTHDIQAQLYTADGGIQLQTPPTPMSLSAMQALPACPTSSSAPAPTSTCSVVGPGIPADDFAPNCPNPPNSIWTEECLPSNALSANSLSLFSETCACFPPPTPALSCDVELSADHFVTVASGGNVSVLLTLCTTCANGVPDTTCTQRCQTNADCAGSNQTCSAAGQCQSVPTLDVAIQVTGEGPLICIRGSGFDPAMSTATLSYSNVPNVPASSQPVVTSTVVQILSDGTVSEYDDTNFTFGLAGITDCPGDVTITLTDKTSGQSATFTEPAIYWCQTTGVSLNVGDFCCMDPTLGINGCN